MKNIIPLLLLFVCLMADAQDSQHGYFGSSYTYATGSKDPVTVKKQFSVIFDRQYCQLTIGDRVEDFKVYAYDRQIVKGNVVETFWNEDAKSLPRGWYSFKIEQHSGGTATVTLNLPKTPGGAVYILDKAQVYSENGKVTGNMHVNFDAVGKKLNHFYNTPPYYLGAKNPVKIDSFMTAKLVDSLHLDSAKWIGSISFKLDIDSAGGWKISEYKMTDHSNNLGFFLKQTIEQKDPDRGLTFTVPPLTVDQFNRVILKLFGKLPKFEPALDEKGKPKSVSGMVHMNLGGSDRTTNFH